MGWGRQDLNKLLHGKFLEERQAHGKCSVLSKQTIKQTKIPVNGHGFVPEPSILFGRKQAGVMGSARFVSL